MTVTEYQLRQQLEQSRHIPRSAIILAVVNDPHGSDYWDFCVRLSRTDLAKMKWLRAHALARAGYFGR